MTATERPLTVIERLLHAVSEEFEGDGMPVFAVRCSGPWDGERFCAALAAVQRRHPLLRSRVVEPRAGWPQFQLVPDCPPIPMEVAGTSDAAWEPVALRHGQQVFDLTRAPLCRMAVLPRQSGEGFDLIAAFHHPIIDGLSILVLLRELLQHMAGQSQDSEICSEELTFRVMRLPTHVQRWRTLADWIRKTTSQQFRPPQLLQMNSDSPGGCVRLVWSPEQTTALIQRCRSERTTFFGALAAAALQTASARHPIKDVLHVQVPVDIRPLYVPPIDRNTLGCFVGIMDFAYRGTRTANFWDLARRCHADVANEHAWLMPNSWDHLMSRVPFTKRWLKPLRRLTVGVNNLGLCEPIAAGPYRVEEMSWFGRSRHLGSSFAANSATINGCLNLTLQADRMTCESLRSLTEDMLQRLQTATNNPASRKDQSPAVTAKNVGHVSNVP